MRCTGKEQAWRASTWILSWRCFRCVFEQLFQNQKVILSADILVKHQVLKNLQNITWTNVNYRWFKLYVPVPKKLGVLQFSRCPLIRKIGFQLDFFHGGKLLLLLWISFQPIRRKIKLKCISNSLFSHDVKWGTIICINSCFLHDRFRVRV